MRYVFVYAPTCEADARVDLTADCWHGAHGTTFLSICEAPHCESEEGARVSDHHTVIMRVDKKHECHRTWPRDSERIVQEQRTPALHCTCRIPRFMLYWLLIMLKVLLSSSCCILYFCDDARLIMAVKMRAILRHVAKSRSGRATCLGSRRLPENRVLGGFLDDITSLFLHAHII
jgi:hypothetical protein